MSTTNDSLTWQDGCKLASKYLKEAKGIDKSPEEIFHSSPTGELFNVAFLIDEAKNYYEFQDNKDKYCTSNECLGCDNDWCIVTTGNFQVIQTKRKDVLNIPFAVEYQDHQGNHQIIADFYDMAHAALQDGSTSHE